MNDSSTDLNDDEVDWSISMASACCLEHMARVLRDAIIEPVLQFIQPKIGSNVVWDRYIGMIAFGAIIEGPNQENFGMIVKDALPDLLNIIMD
jgi:importin subunit beta-1